MTTDPDTLFEDAAPTNPVNQPLPVEHPDFKVRVADFPLPWSAASLKDPEEMTPAELLSAYVDCKRMADGFSLASKEVAKGAEMLEPYVRKIIDARKGMAIPSYIGVTPYNIAIESKTALKLDGEKEDIIKSLQGSKHNAWKATVEAKPDYNTSTLLKTVRDDLKDNGLKKADEYTVENVAQILPPEIGKHIKVETTSSLTFKEQR